MKFIDTHCHLNAEVFQSRENEIINNAISVGVGQLFVVGWNQSSSLDAIRLAHQHSCVKAIIGIHPVDYLNGMSLGWIKEEYLAHREYVVAIGEIGLDYYWKKDPTDQTLQIQGLVAQIQIANQLALPIVIHCRDAYPDILKILKANQVNQGGVMHCYSGPSSLVKAFVDLGFYLSFGGPITFKNAEEARVSVQETPNHRLLIETDSPYLSPVPHRGKENTPEQLPLIFEKLCQIKETSPEIMMEMLKTNTQNIFHVKTK